MNNFKLKASAFLMALLFALNACSVPKTAMEMQPKTVSVSTLDTLPEYSGDPYVVINDDIPYFSESEITTECFETYASLDELGRCGVAYANICKELMPTEKRGEIGHIRPTGWHTVKYDCIADRYLYNRCHLIGFQLAGENDNEKNLITGTRYMNVEGMLPFENAIDDYVDATGNHVLYRVTPVYSGNDLVAQGVLMEAYSVEDMGEGIQFNVFCYNVQPGVRIDYDTGESALSDAKVHTETRSITYILNTNTKKIHLSTCSSVKDIHGDHMEEYKGSLEDLLNQGYDTCKRCNP